MNAPAALLALVLHALVVLLAAPTLAGLLDAGRARLAGRAGPPPLQPWRDLARQLRKTPVLAEQATFLTTGGPYAALAATGAAALLVPSFALGMASAPAADLFVVLGLLGLARLAVALAALDAGTALGGLGASRAATRAVLAAPALALVVLSVTLAAGGTNLDRAAAALREGGPGVRVPLALAAVAAGLVVLVLAERGVSPADGRPELAPRSGAGLLELSGRHLALSGLARQVEVLTWLGLLAALALPLGVAPEGAGPAAWLVGLVAWAVKLAVLGALLVLGEAVVERMPAPQVSGLLGAAAVLALLAAVLLAVGQGAA